MSAKNSKEIRHEIAWAINHGFAWPVPIKVNYNEKLELLEQIRKEIRPILVEKRRAELRLNRIGKEKAVSRCDGGRYSPEIYACNENCGNMVNLVISNEIGGEFFVKGMNRAEKETREASKV